MVVTVGPLNHRSRHAQISGRLPDRHAPLHQPRRRSVPQRMRGYPAPQPGKFDRVSEAGLDRLDRRAVPFDKMRGD